MRAVDTGIVVGRLRRSALLVALDLLAHVAQGVGRTLAVELVDGHELGEVEHVDLLELAGRAVLGRHHVDRDVDQRHDRRIALADARGLDDDQVESRAPTGEDHVGSAPEISLPVSRVASDRM